jgi:hypothetical protein
MDCNWITGSCTCHQTILDDSGGRWRPRAPPTRLLLLLLALFAGRPGSRPVALARSPTYGMGRLTGARKLVEDGRAGRNGDGTAARGLISNKARGAGFLALLPAARTYSPTPPYFWLGHIWAAREPNAPKVSLSLLTWVWWQMLTQIFFLHANQPSCARGVYIHISISIWGSILWWERQVKRLLVREIDRDPSAASARANTWQVLLSLLYMPISVERKQLICQHRTDDSTVYIRLRGGNKKARGEHERHDYKSGCNDKTLIKPSPLIACFTWNCSSYSNDRYRSPAKSG